MKGLLLGGIFALPLLLGLRMRGFLQDRARHLETLEQAAAALEPELRAGRLPPQEALHTLETGASDPLLTGEERETVSAFMSLCRRAGRGVLLAELGLLRRKLEQSREQARQEAVQKGKLYGALGLVCGCGAVLLLI